MKTKTIVGLVIVLMTFFACGDSAGDGTEPEIPGKEEPGGEEPGVPEEPGDPVVMPLIIVAGQSNADGEVPKHTAPEWLTNNDYKIDNYLVWNVYSKDFPPYQLGVNVGSNYYADDRFGFDPFFAKLYLENYGDKLICIKMTLGNTPISERLPSHEARWTPDASLIPTGERSMVGELEWRLTEAREYTTKNNIKLKPIAILFHQGEADSGIDERIADYEQNLTALVARIRGLVGVEDLPFICGEILTRNNGCVLINKTYPRIAEVDKNFRYVSMAEHQTHLGDWLHYDAAAQEYMGSEMFKYYQEIVESKSPAQN